MINVFNKQVSIFRYNETSGETSSMEQQGNFEVRVRAPKQIFMVTKPFDPMDILKSPMGIMMGITLMLFVCMKNMPDMEELKKMEAETRNQTSRK